MDMKGPVPAIIGVIIWVFIMMWMFGGEVFSDMLLILGGAGMVYIALWGIIPTIAFLILFIAIAKK